MAGELNPAFALPSQGEPCLQTFQKKGVWKVFGSTGEGQEILLESRVSFTVGHAYLLVCSGVLQYIETTRDGLVFFQAQGNLGK